jgi:hypothetical protein
VVIYLLGFSTVQAQKEDLYLDFTMDGHPLEEVLDSLSSISGFNFSYNSNIIPDGSLFSFDYSNKTIDQILKELLVGLNISYTKSEDQIILKRTRPVTRRYGVESFSVSGYVREKEGGKDFIPNVSVYLDGTTIGGVTNEDGYFQLSGVPFGTYRIIFSHVAYQNVVYEFSKSTSKELFVNADLEVAINVLDDVEVASDRDSKKLKKNRPKYLVSFKEQFIGTSQNSLQCVIVNPDVLSFDYNRTYKALYAHSTSPLVIQNDALGYRLYCEIDDFFSTKDFVRYLGRVRFEELTTDDVRQAKIWTKNRRQAYGGSIRHFFKSVIEGNHRKQGFAVSILTSTEDLRGIGKNEDQLAGILEPTDIPLRWELKLDRILHVAYYKELESSAYLADMERDFRNDIFLNTNQLVFLKRPPQNQRSVVELIEGPVYVDVNGHVINPEGLSISGYWSWEKMADLVPLNYEP